MDRKTVLIIVALIVIAGIFVVWNFMAPYVQDSREERQASQTEESQTLGEAVGGDAGSPDLSRYDEGGDTSLEIQAQVDGIDMGNLDREMQSLDQELGGL